MDGVHMVESSELIRLLPLGVTNLKSSGIDALFDIRGDAVAKNVSSACPGRNKGSFSRSVDFLGPEKGVEGTSA